jgi:hypothetical protein
MDLIDNEESLNQLSNYDHHGLTWSGIKLTGSHLISNQNYQSVSTENCYEKLKQTPIEKGTLIIIGTEDPISGVQLHEWLLWSVERECTFEWMSYKSACRLIHLLQTDQRLFLCLLIPPK